MSHPIHVNANFACKGKGSQRPLRFWLDAAIQGTQLINVHEIEAIEVRSYAFGVSFFHVRTTEGKRYVLRCDEESGGWTLQTSFDGAELLALETENLTVGPTIREIETRSARCAVCAGRRLL